MRSKAVILTIAMIDVPKFQARVLRVDTHACWEWDGSHDKDGYGYCSVKKCSRKAHRVAYLLANGSLNSNLDVCHSCDNPGCVNPRHLWQGTGRNNIDDMLIKGRSLHGITNPKAKLTVGEVNRIVQLCDTGLRQKDIANIVGCSMGTVAAIATGRQWSRVTGLTRRHGIRRGNDHPRARLTGDLANKIIEMSASSGATEIARTLGLKVPTVYSVISGQTWSHTTGVGRDK